MILSQNEIRARLAKFSEDWKDAKYEKGETQTFYNEFFESFGIKRRSVAIYERQVKQLNDKNGFIDLFWPETLLVEQKSAGLNLEKATTQAEEYFLGLEEKIRPKFILACDFQNFHLIDLDERKEHNFKLSELSDKIEYFNFMRGITQHQIVDDDPVSIQASEMMGKIYDILKDFGYKQHNMEYLLTRLTYCLFADNTGIFESNTLQQYLKNRTSEDGSDLGGKLILLFQTLNTSEEERQKNLDEDLAKFPYINGDLFRDSIGIPSFDSKMRTLLIEACEFNWSKVSPAIFGSLFQSVMDEETRRHDGAHYTTESNILKVIKPLFLDDLNEEFEKIKSIKGNHRKKELESFQQKLSNLKFLDPACGSGNFLIIAYREIRRLELKIIQELYDKNNQLLDTSNLSKIDVDQFYGIEINEFSSRIAETSLWMMDHLMNNELSAVYGMAYIRIPLKKHPNIVNTDALNIDWNTILPSSEYSYIFGNPPFGGAKILTGIQREQIKQIANLGGTGGTLDYVCGWFIKAAQYINEYTTPIGFVSTNSITQGEQVGQLWPILIEKYDLSINFAYTEFKWESEARGKAAVIVIILGLSKENKKEKRLFHPNNNEIIEENPKFISPYLIGTKEILPIVKETSKSLNGISKILMGSKPIDGGHYIFTDDEKKIFLNKEPRAEQLFRPFVNAKEFLNGNNRWILKLHDVKPSELMRLPETKQRIAAVKAFRLNSKSKPTQKLAETPRQYHLNIIPTKPFLVIPATTSERREYIPIGYLEPPIIPSNAIMVVEDASLGLFGLLTSKMHMVWIRTVGGKLKKDLRYSAGLVYNTFPTPDKKYDYLESYAEAILNIRKSFSDSSLVDLYDPNTMPSNLKKAHLKLDKEVEKLYRKKSFDSDYDRMEFLLTKYKELST